MIIALFTICYWWMAWTTMGRWIQHDEMYHDKSIEEMWTYIGWGLLWPITLPVVCYYWWEQVK
jgi:hypothetical protein